jgi:hypothetical protein
MHATKALLALFLGSTLCFSTGACQSAYYATMEKFGVHKRDILVDEVEEGREEQAEAQEQFQSTYEAFQELTGYDGGDLEDLYDRLSDEFESCEGRAADVTSRIEDIEQVASDLWKEWDAEIGEIQSASLKSQSEEMLADTQKRYADLIAAMRKAEAKMEPVLAAFRDHVLFLKHNLNAKAISSLQQVVVGIQGDVDSLIADMQTSIAEADEFLQAME